MYTSGFVDDVMFSHHGQVAVPVGRQTTTEFGRVHENAAPGALSAIYDLLVLIWRHRSACARVRVCVMVGWQVSIPHGCDAWSV